MDMQQEMDGCMQMLKDKISEEESGIHEYVLSHGQWNLDEISPETGMGVNYNAYNIVG